MALPKNPVRAEKPLGRKCRGKGIKNPFKYCRGIYPRRPGENPNKKNFYFPGVFFKKPAKGGGTPGKALSKKGV